MAKWVKGETVRKKEKLDSGFFDLLPAFPFRLFAQAVMRGVSFFGGNNGFRSQLPIAHRQ
jgi:hypothetical protein